MWPHVRRTPVVCVCSRASVHAAHPTRPWHISREHVSSVRAETNALKFKKTPSLNIHSVVSLFLLFLFFITWTDWKAGCIRHAETKENQRYNMIQVNSTVSKQKTVKPNLFFVVFLTFCLLFVRNFSWDEPDCRLNTASLQSKSAISFTKPSMLLVVSRWLSDYSFFVSSRGNTFHFHSLFCTVFFSATLIKTAERSAVSTAALTGFGGRVRLVSCNIIFMFILFFPGDYVQDASWLTDGDVFTPFFSPFFY